MSMRLASVAALTVIVLSTSAKAEPVVPTCEQLIGSWELASFELQVGDTFTKPFGENPTGLLVSSATHMMYMFVADGRAAPAAGAISDEEAVRLFRTSTSWGGAFDCDPSPTPDGRKATYHVSVSENQILTGTDRVFYSMLDGDLLYVISKSQPNPIDGKITISKPTWRRVGN